MTLEELVEMIRSGLVQVYTKDGEAGKGRILVIQGDAGLTPRLSEDVHHLKETNFLGVCGVFVWVERNDVEICPNEEGHRSSWVYVPGTDGERYRCEACAQERREAAQRYHENPAELWAAGRVIDIYPPGQIE